MFKKRTTAPENDNKNWLSTSHGGYNHCIVINKKTGSCIPNCTGYAWGRWREIMAKNPKLSINNAWRWYDNENEGLYKRSKTAQLGDIICFAGGTSGCGHVAIVEEIKPNGDLITSESNYNGERFVIRTRKKTNNYLLKGSTLRFQGFIHLPKEYLPKIDNSEQVHKIALDVINGKYGNGNTRKKKLKKAGYDYDTIQNEVNRILYG